MQAFLRLAVMAFRSLSSACILLALSLVICVESDAAPTVKAEVGGDFRVSDLGPDGDPDFEVGPPSMAWNEDHQEYFVVWSGEDLVDGQFGLFGQRLGAEGVAVGTNDFAITGTDPTLSAPAVAWNSTGAQYLVVWSREVAGDRRIFGQRLDAFGALAGPEVAISSNLGSDAGPPGVAANPLDGTFMVVWSAGVVGLPVEREIFGQRLDATGTLLGGDLRLSHVGIDGSSAWGAAAPAVAHDSTNNQYLVAWSAGDDTLAAGEVEIFAQQLDASGASLGDEIQVSQMGSDGDPTAGAFEPAVSWAQVQDAWLVVWRGDEDVAPLLDEDFEVFGQRLDASGSLLGGRIAVSASTPVGLPNYQVAPDPAVSYGASADEWLVSWAGFDDDLGPGEQEIFLQRLVAATGAPVGADDLRISDMGPDGAANFMAGGPAVGFDSQRGRSLVVWVGDDDTATLVDDELEIFGQLVDFPSSVAMTPLMILANGGANPDLAYNPSRGEHVAVWEASDGNGLGIFAQRFACASHSPGILPVCASVLSEAQRINTTLPGDQREPAIVYDGGANGSFLIVWEGPDADGSGIFGQRMNTDLEPIDGEIQFNTTTAFDQSRPDCAYSSSTNETLVTWTSAGQDGAGDGIIARRSSGSIFLSGELVVNTFTSGDQKDPAAAFDTSVDAFVIAWESAGQDGDGTGIFARELKGASFLTTEFQVNSESAGDQESPDVVHAIGSESTLFVWRSNRKVRGRKRWHGSHPRPSFVISKSAVSPAAQPRVSSNGQERFAVIWEGDVAEGSQDLVAQLVDRDEVLVGNEVSVGGSAPTARTLPVVMFRQPDPEQPAAEVPQELLVVWQDNLSVRGPASAAVVGQFLVLTADLHLDLLDSADPVDIEVPMVYTVKATNDGPDVARAVEIYMTLSPGSSVLTVGGSGASSCAEPLPFPTCTVDELAAGAELELEVEVRHGPGPKTRTLQAEITSEALDPDASRDTDLEATSVLGPIFADGFNSGGCGAWSLVTPGC